METDVNREAPVEEAPYSNADLVMNWDDDQLNPPPTSQKRQNWGDDAMDPETSGQKRQLSDDEPSTTKRQAIDQQPTTYAQVSKPPQATQQQQVSNFIPSHADRHRRTLILRRLPYNTTTEDIVNALQDELQPYLPHQQIDAILRDKDDRRRFYLTFHRYEDKRRIASKGFRIRDFTIPAQSDNASGLILGGMLHLKNKIIPWEPRLKVAFGYIIDKKTPKTDPQGV